MLLSYRHTTFVEISPKQLLPFSCRGTYPREIWIILKVKDPDTLIDRIEPDRKSFGGLG